MHSSPIFTITSILSLVFVIAVLVMQVSEMKLYEMLFF